MCAKGGQSEDCVEEEEGGAQLGGGGGVKLQGPHCVDEVLIRALTAGVRRSAPANARP